MFRERDCERYDVVIRNGESTYDPESHSTRRTRAMTVRRTDFQFVLDQIYDTRKSSAVDSQTTALGNYEIQKYRVYIERG